jgi:hypothetical protein
MPSPSSDEAAANYMLSHPCLAQKLTEPRLKTHDF